MSVSFDAQRGLVVVAAELEGSFGSAFIRLAVDTGATSTLINAAILVSLGYDPGASTERVQVTTGSGVEFAPQINLRRIKALAREYLSFPVLCHTLPPSAGVDGLLGLDFFRGQNLNIDFRAGQIILA